MVDLGSSNIFGDLTVTGKIKSDELKKELEDIELTPGHKGDKGDPIDKNEVSDNK